MNHLRILHNGDLGAHSRSPSPHWMLHVREDGDIWGEYLTRDVGRAIPHTLRVPQPERFFQVPPELANRTLESQPHHEEIILSIVTPSGHWLNSFVMSELPNECPMRDALNELLTKLKDWAEQ